MRSRVDGWRDPNEAYFILQTLVGAWPLTPERLELYLEKALREAKVNTTGSSRITSGRPARRRSRSLLLADAELGAFAERLAERAEHVVLGMTLLKLTCPACRTSTTATSCPSSRSSIPTTGGRRLGGAAARARRGRPAGEARPDPADARAPRAPPGRFRRRLRAARGGRGRLSPSLAAARCSVAVALRGHLRGFRLRRACGGRRPRRDAPLAVRVSPKQTSCGVGPLAALCLRERRADRTRRDRRVYCST